MGSSKDDSATDADNSGGNLPASNSSIFAEGEKVLAYHGPRIYEAKRFVSSIIVKSIKGLSWDEWVGMDRLMELTEDNVLKQQALDKKQGVDKNSKSGRSAQTKPKASSGKAKVDKEDTKNNGREIFFSKSGANKLHDWFDWLDCWFTGPSSQPRVSLREIVCKFLVKLMEYGCLAANAIPANVP
ncbi:hypothetical protein TEA_020308 [Camellia sinensis var. sinensis]|uniref:MRG domain-containing protein n=1 Tax=Camellia sinensis var. sinensis TaxID=542762 RepID=A0A4S4E0P7_CAMSN|nr:hypothetical protein TEA_020308 [Camellia sinensis var. sinensis]